MIRCSRLTQHAFDVKPAKTILANNFSDNMLQLNISFF